MPKVKFKVILLATILSAITPIASYAILSGSLSEEAIKERLAPDGKLNIIQDAATPAAPAAGAEAGGGNQYSKIYENNCKMCHASGLAGAPKFRNKSDWNTRVATGIDTMTKKAVQGFKAMPPKGNCMTCSEDDIKNTIKYMTEALK